MIFSGSKKNKREKDEKIRVFFCLFSACGPQKPDKDVRFFPPHFIPFFVSVIMSEGGDDDEFYYQCRNGVAENETCPFLCVGLSDCSSCECAVVPTEGGGPGGSAVDVLLCLLPVAFLVGVTLMPKPLPTTKSLPLAAFLMFLVRLMYLQNDPLLTCASVILGFHEALTPLSIMAGAITLFETMEATNCMAFMIQEIKRLTDGHPVTELMLIFCFAYMVEGASGFGTPVALGAPMLVSIGYPAKKSVVLLLLMNTFATVWGAVGTPIWFGFGELDLTDDELVTISTKSGISLAISAYFLVPFIFSLVLPWEVLRQNALYMLLGLSACVLPGMGISFVSYEFPSLIGGLIGCTINALLIYFKVGIAPYDPDEHVSFQPESPQRTSEKEGFSIGLEDEKEINLQENRDRDMTMFSQEGEEVIEYQSNNSYAFDLFARTFPLWGSVILLILTRVEQIRIKSALKSTSPNLKIPLGTWGTFRISPSLVLQLQNILNYPDLNWVYESLYVPFLLPFVFISLITMCIFHKEMVKNPLSIGRIVATRLKNPALALMGALVLVQLMITGDNTAPANIIGTVLSDALGKGFIAISGLLGVLGSFFSGSTTVSNLTFGEIQRIAAETIGISTTTMLSIQATGGSAGNGLCLNNIIAACAVVNLAVPEGEIVKKTWIFVFSIVVISTLVNLAYYFAFD